MDKTTQEYKFSEKTLNEIMHTYTDSNGERYQFIDFRKINKRYKNQVAPV